MRVQNLHGLALSGFPLGIACTTCGHRALVEAAKVGARDGNMIEIRQLRFRCTECDGAAFEGTIFSAQDQVDDFLAVLSRGGWPAGVLTPRSPDPLFFGDQIRSRAALAIAWVRAARAPMANSAPNSAPAIAVTICLF
jgi:hypothetical protein